MNPKRSALKWCVAAVGLSAVTYGTYVGVTWSRYGKTKPANNDSDALLDQFMPECEIRSCHKINVAAPAEVTFSAAADTDFESSSLIRGVFKGREWILRSKPDGRIRRRGLLVQTKSLGWGVLAERPNREIVMGCVTKPWEPNPIFRALPANEFAAFDEPGYVKIAWTLRADPSESGESTFRTETRAIATDPIARARFRRYWSLLSPGIIIIRTLMLLALKREAEHRVRAA